LPPRFKRDYKYLIFWCQ